MYNSVIVIIKHLLIYFPWRALDNSNNNNNNNNNNNDNNNLSTYLYT